MDPTKRERCAAAWLDILARIAGGQLITAACAAHNLSREDLFRYRSGNKALMDAWEEARRASADSFFEEAINAARDPHVDVSVGDDGKTVTVRRYADATRVLIDTLKWASAKRNPREYSDKSQVDVNVKTVDLTSIIRDANARLAAAKQTPAIEGQFQRIDNNRGDLDAQEHARTAAFAALPAELAALL